MIAIPLEKVVADYTHPVIANLTTTSTTFYENFHGKLVFNPDGVVVNCINYASTTLGSETGNYKINSSLQLGGSDIGTFTLGVQPNSQFPLTHIKLPTGLPPSVNFNIQPCVSGGANLNGNIAITLYFYKLR